MGLFNTLKDKAIANRQRIILPEAQSLVHYRLPIK